jgi:hypothetical protein
VLIRIETGNLLFSKMGLLLWIVVPLFCNKGIEILKKGAPIARDLWHAVPILKPLSSFNEKLVNKVEAIVLNVLL